MLQLWKLAFLCGLLSGASASLVGDVGGLNTLGNLEDASGSLLNLNDLNVVGKVDSLVGDTVQSVSQTVEQTVSDVTAKVNQAISNIEGRVIPSGILRLKITDPKILDVKIDLSSDGKGIDVKTSISAGVSVSTILTGSLLNLNVKLNLLDAAILATNPETGALSVVSGKCSSDAASLQVKILDNISSRFTLLRGILGTVEDVLSLVGRLVSNLLGNVVCPLVQTVVKALTVQDIQDITCSLSTQRE